VAFAGGRIDADEFDQRMRSALTARTRADLTALLADLPEEAPHAQAAAVRPGRFAISFKSSIRRAGRWRVPGHYTAVVYKGSGLLDLRAAEFMCPLTTIVAVAYKSHIDIAVPPGVRVEAAGLGASTGSDAGAGVPLPPGAPVVRVRGFSYKGTIEATNRPPRQ
jgi:uncharacterized protein DUF1707